MLKHLVDPLCGSRGPGEDHDQIAHGDQRREDRSGIVDERHDDPRLDRSHLDLQHALIEQDDDGAVEHDGRQWIEQGRQTGDAHHLPLQIIDVRLCLFPLTALGDEGADDTDAGKLILQHGRKLIELLLIDLVKRRGQADEAIQDQRDERHGGSQDQ